MALSRRTVIWVARETTTGTDPAMTTANGLLAWDVEFTVNGEKLERPILRDTLSPLSHINGIKETTLTFKTEIKGAGLTGTLPTIPEWGVPISGCGFNTGVYTGTGLVYSLVSSESDQKTLAFRIFMDQGTINKGLGMRGTVKKTLVAGQYGVFDWEFKGLYTAVASGTVPTLPASTTLPPIVYNASFNIAGFSPVCSQAEIDLGNNIVRRDDVNAITGVNSYRLTGRTPKLSFNADAVAESSNPFWGDWDGNVIDTFAIQCGTNAGNTVRFSGIFEYEQAPKNSDSDGVRIYDCVAALVSSNASTSNDELTITLI